jgi:hypothetical protein
MHYSKKYSRLRKAIEYRTGIKVPAMGEFKNDDTKPLYDVFHSLHKRAKSERELDSLFAEMATILEPPNCVVSHCVDFTVYGMCNCSKDLIPGKCPISQAYHQRKAKREADLLAKYIELGKRAGWTTHEDDKSKKNFMDMVKSKGYDKVKNELTLWEENFQKPV